MSKETVTIPKDEYIDLLRWKSTLMEKELAAAESATLPPSRPRSWMNKAEREEVLRLAATGLRAGEIGNRLGRSRSTVRRCVLKHQVG